MNKTIIVEEIHKTINNNTVVLSWGIGIFLIFVIYKYFNKNSPVQKIKNRKFGPLSNKKLQNPIQHLHQH